MKYYFLSFLSLMTLCSFSFTAVAQKQFSLASPDGKLKVEISTGSKIEYSVIHDNDMVLDKSPISMKLADGTQWGVQAKLSGSSRKTVNQIIPALFYKKNQVVDNYNELSLKFKGSYNLIFRAYDDGIAYRFVSSQKKPFIVESEQAEFNFPGNPKAFIAYSNTSETRPLDKQYMNSFEHVYSHVALSEWNMKRLGISPLLVEAPNGKKVCITEADLINYPGMFLYPTDESGSGVKGVFAPYPNEVVQGGHNELQGLVRSRETFLAKCHGPVNFPWRVIIVSAQDHELTDNDMIYKLATPAPSADYSWIKPGKVAWEWWNNWNLYGVDFKAGINNETYKYYIDFAAGYGIEYVILDEGWAVNKQADLFQVVPEIDLKELVRYADAKQVGLILWAGYYAFDRDMENVCKHYSEMGIKGFKIDFMNRDDQLMVDFHKRAAETGLKYKLLVDLHGTYKPTGLHRTYPNVVNYEGVFGLEQMKWASLDTDMVTYDVTMPFIRMVAGPVDYTQGAMRNATKSNYRSIYSEPMSQGTRCRQLAEYIIFESPLNMLCDNPSNYMREEECTRFIASIPTVWDRTIALNGKVGEYITIARQKGDEWYVGSMTNWDRRELEIDLSFLGEGKFKGIVFKDGINAHRAASDYKREVIDIPIHRKLTFSMSPGGGYIIKIIKDQ